MFWTTGITQNNRTRLWLLIGVMLSAMLLPSFEISPYLPNIRIDELLLFGVYGLNIGYFLLRGLRFGRQAGEELQQTRRALKSVRQVFALLVGVIILSNVVAVTVRGGSFGFRDLMEFITIFKYYLVITLVISLEFSVRDYRLLKNSFLAGFTFIVLLSWGEYLNIANMNTWLAPFFNPIHWETLVYGNPARILGTFENPNVMGIFSVGALVLFTARLYFGQDSKTRSALLLVLAGMTVKVIYLTISRTALLATAAVLVYLSLRALVRLRFNKTILLKVGALFLITVTLYVTSPRSFTARMIEGTNLETSTSAQGRLDQWEGAWDQIKESPVLGWGTAKSTMTTVVDDEYMLIARRYGLVGLLAYLWFFIKPFLLAWRLSRRQGNSFDGPGIERRALLGISYTAITIGVLIYNLTAGIFYNLQVMTLLGILMGLIYNTEREEV